MWRGCGGEMWRGCGGDVGLLIRSRTFSHSVIYLRTVQGARLQVISQSIRRFYPKRRPESAYRKNWCNGVFCNGVVVVTLPSCCLAAWAWQSHPPPPGRTSPLKHPCLAVGERLLSWGLGLGLGLGARVRAMCVCVHSLSVPLSVREVSCQASWVCWPWGETASLSLATGPQTLAGLEGW